MTLLQRAALLFFVAAWAPVGIGLFARAVFFKPGKNVRGQDADQSPAPDAEGFRLDNDEPEEGDPNFVAFDDSPLPRGG
jgi:hypothetical protein